MDFLTKNGRLAKKLGYRRVLENKEHLSTVTLCQDKESGNHFFFGTKIQNFIPLPEITFQADILLP